MIRIATSCFAAMLMLASVGNAAVVISSAKTRNMNCSAGVCSPTAANAVLNTADLAAMLGASDVKVTTGAGAVAIGIASPLSWGSSNRLTLDAQHNVSIRSTVVVEGTGGLAITLDDGPSGALNFYPGSSVTFWDTTASLVINGNSYTLVSDVATLAAGIKANHAGYFALAKDYDASVDGAYNTPPIGSFFNGTLEGLGHAIQNLTIKSMHRTDQIGQAAFVGNVGIKGAIRDLSLLNMSETGAPYVSNAWAALVAENDGEIRNVSVTVSINGYSGYFGGLVALAHATSRIVNAHVICTINGGGGLVSSADKGSVIDNSSANCAITRGGAGLAVSNEGSISNSSASGTLTGFQIAGLVYSNSGPITNSYSTVSLAFAPNGYGQAAGLVHDNLGSISQSHASVTFTDNGMNYNGAAGLVAVNYGAISNSWSSTTMHLTGRSAASGLVGENEYIGSIVDCYATGDVSAGSTGDTDGQAAGLVGYNQGRIERSFATGSVTAGGPSGMAGGLVQYNVATVLNSYATGAVTGGQRAMLGGFVSEASPGSITTSYSTGAVAGGNRQTVGGFVGKVGGAAFDDSYWDVETSGQYTSKGATPIHDSHLKERLPAGFDPNVWGQSASINNGYPYLLANPPQ